MPVKIPSSLPAVEILKAENIFVMDDLRASAQDIRPLKLLILNLMPLKIVTETDLLRLISNTPLQIELDFMSVSGHISRNTPLEHIDTFYKDFDEIRSQNYDGMIITGAPVEKLQFEEVDYWNELVERESRIFGVPRDEKLSAATSHDHINSRILRLGKDCQGFILFDIGSAYLGISAVRNVKQVVESSENRIPLVVFMMGEYSEKFFIQRVFGDSVKMVQPGQSSPTNIESRGDVFVRPVENLD